MESRSKFTAFQKKEALSLAQGLFESKVSVERPPTTAQKITYNAARSHNTSKFCHGTKGTKSKKKECISDHQPVYPSWRPFTGQKSLSKDKNKFTRTRNERNSSVSNTTVGSESLRNQLDTDPSEASDMKPRLPRGVEVYTASISGELFEEWTGVSSDPNCFVILPYEFENDVECLPPLQTPDEPLLQRPVKEFKKYIPPKILHNFKYLENETSFQCRHERKRPGKSDQSGAVPRLRTCEIIKQEIEDLERLLQGYGNPNSSSIVNRYQHEITTLKEMVIETLRDYNFGSEIPQEKLEATVIQGDLFEFIARHDEIIAAIEEKRDACVKELTRLERELSESR